MKKLFAVLLSMVFVSGLAFAAEEAVKVEQKTENKAENAKIRNRERVQLNKESKEMKREMKQTRKEARERNREAKSTK